MKLEALTIALRPRTGWESTELGMALARRHFGAVWRPWWVLSLPLLVAINAACWALDLLWLAPLLMWWLKPAFDRIPLYVLSRAVFGQVPGTRETLRALWSWGRPFLLAHLSWRRLSPARQLVLPVDLLEGSDKALARARRQVIGHSVYGVAAAVQLVFLHFEFALYWGLSLLALLFVPNEYFGETAQWLMQAVEDAPAWLSLANNAAIWLATSTLEPFFIGAGLGLYLNRRTALEGWDIEIAFRRLRERLQAAAPLVLVLALGLALGLASAGARAQERPSSPTRQEAAADAPERRAAGTATAEEVFGEERVDATRFERAVERAYADPRVTPKRTVKVWKLRKSPVQKERPPIALPSWLAAGFAFLAKFGLWMLLGLLVLALLATARHWLPWLAGGDARDEQAASPIRTAEAAPEAPLPPDVPAAARALWRAGRPRDALALVYRASVAAMAERAQVTLVPGATEAECLRSARRMPLAEDREAFVDAVRVWQYAAYAQRLPDDGTFDALLDRLSLRFGWVP